MSRNDISLVTYTGPVPTRLSRASYHSRDFCHYPACGEIRSAQLGTPEESPTGKVSMLYTGDITCDRLIQPQLEHRFTNLRWQQLRFLQVPHHGSRHSWEPGQAPLWPHQWSVISAGQGNQYGHPAMEVLEELRAHAPVLVNELQGVAWSGQTAWDQT